MEVKNLYIKHVLLKQRVDQVDPLNYRPVTNLSFVVACIVAFIICCVIYENDNIEVVASADISTKKITKVKCKKLDEDCETTMEDDASAKETDDDDDKDIAGSGDGTQEISKPVLSEESMDDTEPAAHEDMEMSKSVTEAEDDNISVTIQAEDAITLDCDGYDLLETGKHVKIADLEANKAREEPGAAVKESLWEKRMLM
ncbi:hypothetical protein NDU88_002684 [Pleurodeles waltl]|uniref:Uncharacterized protein n=1 Tax=Pleurodeles waltl TaxID=8319 RepID=A0AAV7RGE9_PLEWA|nr:hypothetical protein NDU88_002684 [Pleurodeles waltl]